MNCPFFKEERVKYCAASGYRKMILLEGADTDHEMCSGPSYTGCSLAGKDRSQRSDSCSSTGASPVCPSLQESLVQYCTAAAFQKFVPASEPTLLKCGRAAYRYCDLYRTTVSVDSCSPSGHDSAFSSSSGDLSDCTAVNSHPPAHLDFSPNHIWLDRSGGQCQIGIDGFLADVVGSVEHLTFLTVGGLCEPRVVLTVKGVDLHLAFPNQILITAANVYLRAEPIRLTADPYGAGWLFEGSAEDTTEAETWLVPGSKAGSWMREEYRRLNDYLNKQVRPRSAGQEPAAGHSFSRTAPLEGLSREQILSLFSEFFPIHARRGR